MNPIIKESMRIANKHLKDECPERRKALALDIQAAIVGHAVNAVQQLINQARSGEIAPPNDAGGHK